MQLTQEDINEFKDEFYERIEYANERFREGKPGWKTDRGRIYIYFGPPDRIERYPMTQNVGARAVEQWIYYRYQFGIEFIDKGDGSYTFDPVYGVGGSFFTALEEAQFGLSQQDQRGFARKFMDFDLVYDKKRGEIILSVPADKLVFTEEEEQLKAEFDFEFFFYKKKSTEKVKFQETKQFETTVNELVNTKSITFSFRFDVEPGKYIVDVIIIGRPDLGKARKIFDIKI
jgi:hypothetical protein